MGTKGPNIFPDIEHIGKMKLAIARRYKPAMGFMIRLGHIRIKHDYLLTLHKQGLISNECFLIAAKRISIEKARIEKGFNWNRMLRFIGCTKRK